jgi:hypothetical protein
MPEVEDGIEELQELDLFDDLMDEAGDSVYMPNSSLGVRPGIPMIIATRTLRMYHSPWNIEHCILVIS